MSVVQATTKRVSAYKATAADEEKKEEVVKGGEKCSDSPAERWCEVRV